MHQIKSILIGWIETSRLWLSLIKYLGIKTQKTKQESQPEQNDRKIKIPINISGPIVKVVEGTGCLKMLLGAVEADKSIVSLQVPAS